MEALTDARVEHFLNKLNEVDAVSLTLGTFLATNCRSLPRKSQAKELQLTRHWLRKGILRLAEKNLVSNFSMRPTQSLFACFVFQDVGLSS